MSVHIFGRIYFKNTDLYMNGQQSLMNNKEVLVGFKLCLTL